MKILSIYIPSITFLQGIDSFSLISRREIPLQPQQRTNLKSEQEDCSTILNLKNQHYDTNNNCLITKNIKVTKVQFNIIETSSNYLDSTEDWSSSDTDGHNHDCCSSSSSSSPSTINLKDNTYDSNHHMKVAKVSFNTITRDEATTNATSTTTSLPYKAESYHYDDYDNCPKIINIKKTNGHSNTDNHCGGGYNSKVTNVDFNIIHNSININNNVIEDAPTHDDTNRVTADNDQSNRNSNCSIINLKQDNNDNFIEYV